MRASGGQDKWNTVHLAVAFVALWAGLVGVGLQLVALVMAMAVMIKP